MGMDLWFREDVMRILASTHETMRATRSAIGPQATPGADAYERGFADALRAVGLGFGLALLDMSETRGPGAAHDDREVAASRWRAGRVTGTNRGGGRWNGRNRDWDLEEWE